eukprot:355090-Pelagomonas_calceolata.AAC.1
MRCSSCSLSGLHPSLILRCLASTKFPAVCTPSYTSAAAHQLRDAAIEAALAAAAGAGAGAGAAAAAPEAIPSATAALAAHPAAAALPAFAAVCSLPDAAAHESPFPCLLA